MTTRDEIERLVHVYGEAICNQAEPDECELRYMALLSAIDRALAERDARIAVLEKALREYGKHKTGCYDKRQVVPRCVCGLNAALATEKP